MTNSKQLTKTMALRISDAEDDRLGRLARHGPLTRHALARFAIRIGLDALEEDPAMILGEMAGVSRPAGGEDVS